MTLRTRIASALLVGAVVVAAPAAALTGGAGITVQDGRPEFASIRLDKAKYGTVCAGASDGTATLGTALTDAAAANGELFLPKGCVPLLASPGAGLANLTIPSGVTIRCEDQTAGFTLATKVCVGGNHAGAACTNTTPDCNAGGGVCTGTVYATTGGSVYTAIKAASSSTNVAVIGCTIWANGIDGYYTCNLGTHAGEPCVQTCATDATLRCTVGGPGGQCPSNGACTLDTLCSASGAGGTCVGAAGSPVGPGKVTPIDLSASTNARVENVRILDHRRGDVAINVSGDDGKVRNVEVNREPYRYAVTQIDTITQAVLLGVRGLLEGSRIYNPKGVGVEAGVISTYARVIGNFIQGNVATSTGVGDFGFSTITGNVLTTHLIGSKTAADSTISGNNIFLSVEGVAGCKTGTLISGNAMIFTGPVRFGSTETLCGGQGHSQVSSNLWASFSNGPCFKLVTSGKRCVSGAVANEFKTCTTSANCGGSSCTTSPIADALFASNNCYLGGVDASGTDADSPLSGLRILGNFLGPDTFLDATSPSIRMSTTATTTGTVIAGNTFGTSGGTGGSMLNWQDSMGILGVNYLPHKEDRQYQAQLRLQNEDGAAMVAGEAVAVDSAAGVDNAVKRATNQRDVVGIVLTAGADATQVPVLTSGLGTCVTTDVATGKGDRLKLSATAGRGELAASTDNAYAIALATSADQGAYHTVRCWVGHTPGVPSAFTGKLSVTMAGSDTCGTDSVNMYFGVSGCSQTVGYVDWVVPQAMTVTEIQCNAQDTGDNVCTYVFTLQKNGADQAGVTCTTTNEVACADAGSVAYAASDTLAIEGVDSAGCGTNTTNVSCIVSYTVP